MVLKKVSETVVHLVNRKISARSGRIEGQNVGNFLRSPRNREWLGHFLVDLSDKYD